MSTLCSAGCRADLSKNIVGSYHTGLYNNTDLHQVVHISLNSPPVTTSIGTYSVEGAELESPCRADHNQGTVGSQVTLCPFTADLKRKWADSQW